MLNNKKNIPYAIAACLTIGAISITTVAAPVAGVVGMSSTDTTTVASSSYSTLAGVSLTMANILADASAAANSSQVADNTTTTVAEAQSEYADVAIAQVDNYVNIRSTASEEGEVVGKLYDKSAATVLATEGDWYQITSGNCTGYVKSEFVVVGDEELAKSVSTRLATVTTQTLYVREEATTESSVLGMVPEGDDLVVVDESQASSGWVKVSLLEYEGYVSTEFVTLSTDYVTAESKEEEEARLKKEEAERKAAAAAAAASRKSSGSYYTGSSSSYAAASGSGGSAVVSYASQFVGNPYVYGGSSLTSGTDCSGFVMSVYSAFGVSLPHSSSAMRSVGYGVDVNSMQAGDIVCYSGHVGIYTGSGTIVNALNSNAGITYTNVNYSPILAVRRIY